MKYFTAIMILAVLAVSCGTSDNGKEQLLSEITYLEQELAANTRQPAEKLDSLLAMMESYARSYPKDSLAAGFLFRVGEMAQLKGQHEKALAVFDQVMKDHDGTPQAARALFMKGFTLDNDLQRFDEAKEVYELFLKKYPNDAFAKDADFLLKNLGKSGEEILREFEKNQ